MSVLKESYSVILPKWPASELKWTGYRRRGISGVMTKKRRLVKIYGSICIWCKEQFTIEDLTLEHMTRRREGGSNSIDNLMLACSPCNTKRG